MEYKARCHCGRVRFSFRSPEIRTGKRCNCSLCLRRGAVLSSSYIPAADFTPHHDPSELGVYLWNERVLNNYFCKSCGIFVYIGDGANDVDMITAAGLGVAYRAKPVLAGQADARLNKNDLTSLLYFQGYGADRFVTG